MKNQRIIIAALLAVMAFTGCAQNGGKEGNEVNSKGDNKASISVKNKENIKDGQMSIDKYDMVGEIIEFREDSVDILTGDIAQNYKVDKNKLKEFYLGETVGVKRNESGNYDIESFIVKDKNYDIRHTSMGLMIESKKGTVNKITDSKLTLQTKEGDMEFNLYSPIEVEKGANIIVDYTTMGGEMSLIQYYNEASKLELTVKKIERAEKTGVMIIEAEDNENMKYVVSVDSGTVLNFSHSTLKVDDKIVVYADLIKESYPAQVGAKKIEK